MFSRCRLLFIGFIDLLQSHKAYRLEDSEYSKTARIFEWCHIIMIPIGNIVECESTVAYKRPSELYSVNSNCAFVYYRKDEYVAIQIISYLRFIIIYYGLLPRDVIFCETVCVYIYIKYLLQWLSSRGHVSIVSGHRRITVIATKWIIYTILLLQRVDLFYDNMTDKTGGRGGRRTVKTSRIIRYDVQ